MPTPCPTENLSVAEPVRILIERHEESNGFEFVPLSDLRALIGACVDGIASQINETETVQ